MRMIESRGWAAWHNPQPQSLADLQRDIQRFTAAEEKVNRSFGRLVQKALQDARHLATDRTTFKQWGI